jgi:FMN phosphatase YigB (HAD superfamily)
VPERTIHFERVKVVSWDVDGTLYSLPAFMAALRWYLLRGFFSSRWLEVWADFFGLLRFKRTMDRVRAAEGEYAIGGPVPGRDQIAVSQHRIYGAILPRLGLLPGVEGLLRWFGDRGIKQVVLSDYLTTGKLEALGVAEVFSHRYTGEQFGHLKPSHAVFLGMCADLGIKPEELLHIGDRPDTDGAAAPALGYQVAIIGRDFETAEDLRAALASEE